MYGYVYLTTNLVNNKKYIGKHTSNVFDKSYQGSGLLFLKAQKKYGRENFSVEILKECYSAEELDKEEIYQIEIHNAVEDDNYYNTSYGGTGNARGLKTMYNKSLDKVIMTDASHIEYYAQLGYELGMRPHSEETRERHREAKANKIPITNGEITKYIDKSELNIYEENGWRKGRDHATRPNQKSEHRKWMNKDGKSIMVKGEEVQEYLDNGYVLGRTHFDYHRDFDKYPVWNKGKRVKKT